MTDKERTVTAGRDMYTNRQAGRKAATDVVHESGLPNSLQRGRLLARAMHGDEDARAILAKADATIAELANGSDAA